MATTLLLKRGMLPATDEETWLRFLRNLPEWRPSFAKRVVVIAPHPDDETLGAGGLIADQRRLGVPVLAVAVTDGEAAYADREGLAERRCLEQEAALQELGVASGNVTRLRLPDSGVTPHEQELASLLRTLIEPGDLVVAPWRLDPHPDHEACGRAARVAAEEKSATLVSYFFWTWHHNRVDSLAGLPLRQFHLDENCQAHKARALAHHNSQLQHASGFPVLPEILLAPARRPFETFLLHD